MTFIDALTLFIAGFCVGGIIIGTVAHHIHDEGLEVGMKLGRLERVVARGEWR
jgi:hypothetical protein